jgi:hypothetical protein
MKIWLYAVKRTGLNALQEILKKLFILTSQFRDHNDISVPLVKLRAETDILQKMQVSERDFCKDFDVARTRKYGGIASTVIFINPLKIELHLNFRLLGRDYEKY